MMSLQMRACVLLGVLLALVGWDDYRRAHAPAPAAPAPAAQAAATTQAAPQVHDHGTTTSTTVLKCSDGTSVTQTDKRHESETASAPTTTTAMASVAQPTTPSSELGAYAPPNYSVTVTTNPLRPHDIGASLGIRLGTLPLHVEVGAEMDAGSPEFRAGLRLDL